MHKTARNATRSRILLNRHLLIGLLSLLVVQVSILIPTRADTAGELEHLGYGYPFAFIDAQYGIMADDILTPGEGPRLFTPRLVPFFTDFPRSLWHLPHDFYWDYFLLSLLTVFLFLEFSSAALRWASAVRITGKH
jgi:hypothetical protein